MAREREQPVVVVERSDSGLGVFFLGVALGAVAGLLLAPRTGEETRRMLRVKGRELWSAAVDKAENLRELVEEGYEHSKARVEESLESVRRSIDDRRTGARETPEAGRGTGGVHSAREELERRLSEARAARRTGRRASEQEPTEE